MAHGSARPSAAATPARRRQKSRAGAQKRPARTAQDGSGAERMVQVHADGLLEGARRFASSHPAWFWGGAFVTGLALARLLKATDTSTHASSDEGGIQ
jgi:hypothetical protein